MNHLILTLACFVTITTTWSSTSKLPSILDLEGYFTIQKQQKTFHRNWTQTKKIKSVPVSIESKGVLDITPEQMVWEIIEPSPLKVTIHKDAITILSTTLDGKLKKEEFDKKQIGEQNFAYLEDLYAVWQADLKHLEKRYSVQDFDIKNKKILLKPIMENAIISTLEITLNKQSLLNKVIINESSGDLISIDLF